MLGRLTDRSSSKALLPFVGAALFSGMAGLVYEVLWVRQLGSLLGNTTIAVSLVLSIFFFGMGVGAWWLGRFIDRVQSPLRIFVTLEILIALAGLVFFPASESLDSLYTALAPADWAFGKSVLAKGVIACALLAIPTFCMGGTLPVLVRLATRHSKQFTVPLGVLYGSNTLGAALGVFIAMFVLIPRFGLQGAAGVAATFNGLAVLVVARGASGAVSPQAARGPEEAVRAGGQRVALLVALWSGFISVGLEVLWTRALSTRFLSTVYSFAAILVVYLFSLGVGSLFVVWLKRRALAGRKATVIVLLAGGVSSLLSVFILTRIPGMKSEGVSSGFGQLQALEFGLTALVIFVPTLLFGLTFPLLGRIVHGAGVGSWRAVGNLYLASTLGSVAGPLVISFVLLPALGLKLACLLLGWGSIAVAISLLHWAELAKHTRVSLVTSALTIGGLLSIGSQGAAGLWKGAEQDTLLYYHDGAAASIAVVESPGKNRILKVDNSYHLGTSQQSFAQARQGLIPVLLANDPQSALVIGLATGGSAGSVAAWGLRTDILEIVPGLKETLPFFADINEGLLDRIEGDPNVRFFETDGRHFVRTTQNRYDLVISDLYVPWRAGEGAMYTRDHLDAIRGTLAPGGLFCQWLPLYQLRPAELKTIVATFCDVFPVVETFWLYFNGSQPVIGLFGAQEPLVLRSDAILKSAANDDRKRLMERAGLTDMGPLVGSWIAGRDVLMSWTRGAQIEMRRRPTIEFDAPWSRYGTKLPPAAENVPLLLELSAPLSTASFLGSADEELIEGWARYQQAIRLFFLSQCPLLFEGRLEPAVEALSAAMEETPEWGWIAFNLERSAEDALRSGQFELALRAARALRAAPSFRFSGLFYGAHANIGLGHNEQAAELAKQARAIRPTHPGILDLLKRLNGPIPTIRSRTNSTR